jgi:hypothetical protein
VLVGKNVDSESVDEAPAITLPSPGGGGIWARRAQPIMRLARCA